MMLGVQRTLGGGVDDRKGDGRGESYRARDGGGGGVGLERAYGGGERKVEGGGRDGGAECGRGNEGEVRRHGGEGWTLCLVGVTKREVGGGA